MRPSTSGSLERWPSPVEGDGLENRYGSLAHREFKSLPLRSLPAPNLRCKFCADTSSVLPLLRGPSGCQGSADARRLGLARPAVDCRKGGDPLSAASLE